MSSIQYKRVAIHTYMHAILLITKSCHEITIIMYSLPRLIEAIGYSIYTSTSAVWNIMHECSNHIQHDHEGEACMRDVCAWLHTSALFHTALVG